MRRNIGDIINKPYVDNGAYRVPEGYFDDLKKQLVADKVKKTHWARYAVAASITAVIIAAGTLTYFNHAENNTQLANSEVQEEVLSEQYVNDCLEYAMVDDADIYTYLAAE